MIDGHGDDIYKYSSPIKINFSSNVYSHADLSRLETYLKGQLHKISAYPEPQAYSLERKIAEKKGVLAENVLVTNGATEAIYLVAQAFSGTASAIVQPTFSEYADACIMNKCQTQSLYSLPGEKQGFKLHEGIGMCWMCNPNNPTGQVTDVETLTKIAKENEQVLFVIDQSYEDFTMKQVFNAENALRLSNLVLLHSMTKRYCVPGIRLGYITAPMWVISRLRSFKMPWSVNALAVEAGTFLLENGIDGMPQLSDHVSEARRLRNNLNKLGGVEAWESDTQFMLVRLRYGKASALKDYLIENHGILIRDASNFEGLDEGFFRIAAQLPEEDDMLVNAISEWLEE